MPTVRRSVSAKLPVDDPLAGVSRAVRLAEQASEDAAAADGRIDDVLDGTESHTALNVGGTDVKPLLDKSDGSKFDDVTAVEQGLITPSYAAFTSGSVTWTASGAEESLQTVTTTVVRGDVVITASCSVYMSDATMTAADEGRMRLYRDGVEIANAQVVLRAVGYTASYQYPPQFVLNWLDTPGPGTFDYEVTFEPSMTLDGQINRRFLSALPLEG